MTWPVRVRPSRFSIADQRAIQRLLTPLIEEPPWLLAQARRFGWSVAERRGWLVLINCVPCLECGCPIRVALFSREDCWYCLACAPSPEWPAEVLAFAKECPPQPR